MSVSNETTRSGGSDEPVGKFEIEFIDPLFAVAIHVGLAEGLFHEHWFVRAAYPSGKEWLHLFTFGLGLLTLVLAWLGYHRSVRKRKIKGFARFIIDILLVILYAVVLVKYRDLDSCLLTIVWVYVLYALWDLFKIIEYQQEYASSAGGIRYAREFTTLIWLAVFLLIWLGFRLTWWSATVALLLAYGATVLHRVNKSIPIWTSLWRALVRLFVHGARA